MFADFSPTSKPPTRRKGLTINPLSLNKSGLLEYRQPHHHRPPYRHHPPAADAALLRQGLHPRRPARLPHPPPSSRRSLHHRRQESGEEVTYNHKNIL